MSERSITDFITLTDMWGECKYYEVGKVINDERWSSVRVAEFCAYFGKYAGVSQLNILYKFL